MKTSFVEINKKVVVLYYQLYKPFMKKHGTVKLPPKMLSVMGFVLEQGWLSQAEAFKMFGYWLEIDQFGGHDVWAELGATVFTAAYLVTYHEDYARWLVTNAKDA